jgi:hypothetical protein
VHFAYDDEGNTDVNDAGVRIYPGNWAGNVIGVDGVDTRRCHVYYTNLRIKRGSVKPGMSDICELDFRFATKYRYGMMYAVAEKDGPYDAVWRSVTGYSAPGIGASELADLEAALAATLPADGNTTLPPNKSVTGLAPFYLPGAAYGRPINLFKTPESYLKLRRVFIPGASDNETTYSSLVVEPPYASNGTSVKVYQKLVLNGGDWDPDVDAKRLATALFYPPQQYALEGLRVVGVTDAAEGDMGFSGIATRFATQPTFTAWKLITPGSRVSEHGDMLDAVYAPMTWHEQHGFGLQLMTDGYAFFFYRCL